MQGYNIKKGSLITKDSLNKRYFFKILGKLITAPMTLIIQALLPRGLGPETYGKYIFQTNVFQQVIAFFDTGTSLAFYTKLSKRPDDKSLIRFYGGFTLISAILILLFTSIIFILNQGENLFPGQEMRFIFMAIFFAVITWWSETIYKIIDAYGLTTKGEIILVYQKIISVLALFIIYLFNNINLLSIFLYNYFILFILIFWWTRCLYQNGIFIHKIKSLTRKEIKEKTDYLWKFSSPLITYSFFGMIISFFDNWLLMKISGPIQQGFFGLAFKLSSISFMFTGAMTQLITREFSVAHEENDKPYLAFLFNKYIPLLYLVATYISVFLIIYADFFTNWFGGKEYLNGTIPIAIMLFYPIHQTYGQLSGSLFYSTGQTKLYRNIGISMMPLGIVFTWVALAPLNLFGFSMGAIGLALKTVVLQFIAVNVQLYFNTKYLSLSFPKYLLHQFYVLGLFLICAYFSRWIIQLYIVSNIISFLLSGFIYTLLILIIVYLNPQFISLSKYERDHILLRIYHKIKPSQIDN